MLRYPIIAVFVCTFAVPCVVWSQVAKRDRIAFEGKISLHSMGVPVGQDSRTVVGDTIVVNVEVQPNEKIIVGAYLFYSELGDRENWKPVPANNDAYRSSTFGGLGRSVEIVLPRGEPESNLDVVLFLPHRDIGLQQGKYRFKDRIAVWQSRVNGRNTKRVDDYFTSINYEGTIRPGRIYWNVQGAGPSTRLWSFQLLNADNPFGGPVEQ